MPALAFFGLSLVVGGLGLDHDPTLAKAFWGVKGGQSGRGV